MAGEGQGDQGRAVTGRARVRALVVAPIEALGVRRPQGVKVDAWRDELTKICDDLVHLSDDDLGRVHVAVENLTMTRRPPVRWPRRCDILALCNRLVAAGFIAHRPESDRDLHVSWMISRAGARARAAGYAPELFLHLRRMKIVPGPFLERELKVAADANRDKLRRLQARVADGRATESERVWLRERAALVDRVDDLIDRGIQKRQAQQEQAT